MKMGSGATKEKCANAGFYKEEINVGEEDQGFKVLDLHGSGMATFLIGMMFGVALTSLLVFGFRRLGLSCGRRRHRRADKEPADIQHKQRQDALHLFSLPPALPALQHIPLNHSFPTFGATPYFDHPRRDAPSPRFSEVPQDTAPAPTLPRAAARAAPELAPSFQRAPQRVEVDASPAQPPQHTHSGHMA